MLLGGYSIVSIMIEAYEKVNRSFKREINFFREVESFIMNINF